MALAKLVYGKYFFDQQETVVFVRNPAAEKLDVALQQVLSTCPAEVPAELWLEIKEHVGLLLTLHYTKNSSSYGIQYEDQEEVFAEIVHATFAAQQKVNESL